MSAAGIQLAAIDIGPQLSTFEFVAARVTSALSSCVVAVVYRPGSSSVSAAFFTELLDVLDQLSTFADPVVLAGDVHVRLECTTDPHTVELCDLVTSYGLVQRVSGCTHDAGGTLDVVCTRDDLPPPTVDVFDTGLSDHCLLCWQSCLLRPPPVYVSTTRRSWRLFNDDSFCADLLVSALCDEHQWTGLDGDVLVNLYNDTMVCCLTDRFHCGPRPVAVHLPTHGSTTSVSVRCGQLSALHVVPDHTQTLRRPLLWRGSLSTAVISA